MISLFTYSDVKRLTEERQRRSLARFEAKRAQANDSYVRPSKQHDADVVELAFGTACSIDRIGA